MLNPGPATTTDSVKYAQVVPDICPREEEFGALVDWIQNALIKFVGTPGRHACVLIGGSGTAAVEMVLSSVVPHNSALLVINNGDYAKRMIKIAETYKMRAIEFASPDNKEIDYPALERCIVEAKAELQHEKHALSHLAVVHHETTSGLLNRMEPLGALSRKHGLSLISDAMSSYAAIPIDMDSEGIDYVISSSNKNLQGMAGVGIVLCSKTALERSQHIARRNLYLNLFDQYHYFLKTKQFRFTPPVQTLYALKKAIEETMAETVSARYMRYLESYRVLRQGMVNLGFKVLVPDALSSGLITTFHEPRDARYSFTQMHDYLYRHGFTIYPGKISRHRTFRLANIGDINKKDIEDFLHLLRQYLKEFSIQV